ncbi:hypothetical protein [Xanthomonas phage JGB6]|nr:hypothetical protein [Xanthomonas phage JGB6]
MINIDISKRHTRDISHATLLALLLALTSAPVAAESLYTLHAEQTETLDSFVERIAPTLLTDTFRLGAEVCGVIAVDPQENYAVNIVTTRVNNACTMRKSDVPEGFTYAGMTLHTHPELAHPHFHDADYAEPGYLVTYRGIAAQQGRGTERRLKRLSEATQRNCSLC